MPSAPTVDRFIGFELGPMFVPYGRIPSLDAYRGLLGIPQCIGAKHSSLSRQAGVGPPGRPRRAAARLPRAHRQRPGHRHGRCTGRTTCWACRPSPPRPSPPATACGPTAIPASTSSTTCCSTWASSPSAPRCPAYRHDAAMAFVLRGWATQRRHPAGRAPPSRGRPGRAGRHPRAAGGAGVSARLTQVKKLDTLDDLRAHLDALGVELPVADEVEPDGVLSTPVEVRDGSRRHAHRCPTASRCCPWRGGTAPPTAVPPTWCAAGGAASAPAAAAWCGARPPRCAPTAGPTPTSWCSDETTVDDAGRAPRPARPRPGGRRCS